MLGSEVWVSFAQACPALLHNSTRTWLSCLADSALTGHTNQTEMLGTQTTRRA